jgi:hypothetical protein
MDPLAASIGLHRLVQRHYPAFLNWRTEGAVLIRLDQGGNIIGTETLAGVRAGVPRPGSGYYAHIQLTGIAVGAAVGGERDVWEVRGPDWAATLTIYEPVDGGPSQVVAEISRATREGLDFLMRFA